MLAGSLSAIQYCRAPFRTGLCRVGSVAQIILGPVSWTLQVAMESDVTDNRFWADRLAFVTLPANKTLLSDEMQV